ncbi:MULTISPECIES: glycosyltransferase family 4 protein [Salinibaculum]|uniref:glycosyltransferase family 4 protein n=1 Tax=Salinibaculum TaxID=2732368 RepID=UPI0030CB89A2
MRAVLTLLPYLLVSETPTIWNIGLGLTAEGFVRKLQWISLKAIDHVFIESEKQARRVFNKKRFAKHRHKFTIFHKGIDTSKFNPSQFESAGNHDQYRIGTAASITPRKGLIHLIDALPTIIDEHKNIELLIAGKTPKGNEAYRQRIEEKIRTLRIDEHIEFLGWVENMPYFLDSLDIFVLPSLNEGVPGAVREAMAMEVPTIATDVGGTADLITNDDNGILIQPKSSDEISDAVITLLNHPEKRVTLGKRGRKTIKNRFSMESYIRDYEEFLTEINQS